MQLSKLQSMFLLHSKMNYCKTVLLLCSLVFRATISLSNEWSNCSRSCGMGISHRSISCQNTNCIGIEKEFQFCNLKECPAHFVDFRSEQCQRYGKELVPFVDESNPCKLMCMLPGQKPVDKATAVDGTSCLSGGVCVDGVCVPVGCDGILGSIEKIDECGRCGATNGICLRVPCMVNHNLTSNEYTVTLPVRSTRIKIIWVSSCRISVLNSEYNNTSSSIPANQFLINGKELTIDGPLKEQITVKINCHEDDHTLTCGYHVPLYEEPKYGGQNFKEHDHRWIVGDEFTTCSQTCGIGVQRSKIYCQNVATEKIVKAQFCNNLSTGNLDTRMKLCNMLPCPNEWQVTDWSPCSESCGGGYRIRNVTCAQVINTLTNPVLKNSTLCFENKPRSEENCNHHPCYNHWHNGSWSDCSSSCGNGTRTRNISCINAYGNEIEANNCTLLMKPKEEEKCIGEMCTYKWITSDWSNCSVDCGQGNQTRNVYCQYIMEEKPVNDSLCLQDIKPTKIKQCQGSQCIGDWMVEEWGPCEASQCHSKGLKYRNPPHCIFNDSIISDSKCNSSKPNTSEECYKTDGTCPPMWVPLPWRKCSKTCNGMRIRGLECRIGDESVDEKKCLEPKPTTVEECNKEVKCNPGPCTPKPVCENILKLQEQGVDVSGLCKTNCCKCKSQ